MEGLTIDRLVDESAKRFGDRTALERLDGEGRRVGYTYLELQKRMELLARGMRADGVEPGDRIAIMGENSPQWGLAALAALRIGGVLVPVDQKATAKELERTLIHAGCRRLIATAHSFEKLGALPPVEKIWFIDKDSKGARFEGISGLAKLGSQSPALPEHPLADQEDLALIVYTSGTTGDPKGVMLTHKNVLSNIEMIFNRLSASETDAFTSILPLSHMLEFTCGFCLPLAVGASVHYVGSFNPADIVKTMATCQGTILIGVPRLFQGMWRRFEDRVTGMPGWKQWMIGGFRKVVGSMPALGKLLFREVHARFGGKTRFWVSGGAPLDTAVAEGFASIGIQILNGYGLTETAPVLAANAFETNRIGSVGRALPGVEIKIFDADESGIGEVAARGPNVSPGYYKNKPATEASFRDGWFMTGDLGKLTPEGFLELRGRSKSLIVTPNGKKIHPEEIEEYLARSALFQEVAVIGVPETEGSSEEVVTAVVLPTEEALAGGFEAAEKAALKEVRRLTAELSEYKRPRRIVLRREPMPRTHTLKVKRNVLLKELLLVPDTAPVAAVAQA